MYLFITPKEPHGIVYKTKKKALKDKARILKTFPNWKNKIKIIKLKMAKHKKTR